MYQPDSFAIILARIEAAIASGRLCVHAAGGMRARIQEAEEFLAAGVLDQEQANRNAKEAEEMAFAFGPQGRR